MCRSTFAHGLWTWQVIFWTRSGTDPLKEAPCALHALVELAHKWHLALDTPAGGNMIHIPLLDFSKAFDRVDHNILMRKLAGLGLPNFSIQWLTALLMDRKQRVKIGSVESDWVSINAGVPQGTFL